MFFKVDPRLLRRGSARSGVQPAGSVAAIVSTRIGSLKRPRNTSALPAPRPRRSSPASAR